MTPVGLNLNSLAVAAGRIGWPDRTRWIMTNTLAPMLLSLRMQGDDDDALSSLGINDGHNEKPEQLNSHLVALPVPTPLSSGAQHPRKPQSSTA